MKLKTAWTVQLVLALSILLCIPLVELSGMAALIAALVLFAASTTVRLLWCRCPHCGALLWRQYGTFCPDCDGRLDE